MPRLDDLERVQVTSRAQWRRWLAKHHGQAESIWLVTFKKADAARHVPYGDIVEEALCFGWIDSLPRALDDARTMLLVSPRKAGSPWSALNKRRVRSLARAGLIQPAGQAKIDAAKRDGSWTVYDEIERLTVPEDLAEALDATPGARAGYESFAPSARKGLLWWIKSAKRSATRAERIARTTEAAAQGRIANRG
ncbi:MAG: YdeI/OmpD-associated family protein [Phycisphaerales bacterium]